MCLVHDVCHGTTPAQVVRRRGRGAERRAGGGSPASHATVAQPSDRRAGTRPGRRAVRPGEAPVRADGSGGDVPRGRAGSAAPVGRGGSRGTADATWRVRDVAAALRSVGDVRGSAPTA